MLGNNRVAIIDLGSNTFHLLIVDISPSTESFSEVYRERNFVYLSKGGLQNISDESYKKGILTLIKYSEIVNEYKASKVFCVGTAALRSANNGKKFIEEAHEKSGIRVDLIDGDREAELIFKGISLSHLPSEEVGLVADIGGGSVEFILFQNEHVLFQQSVEIGISVLRSQLDRSDPISEQEIEKLFMFLAAHLRKVYSYIQKLQPTILVGASGPFEIMESILGLQPSESGNLISSGSSLHICNEVMSNDLNGRKNIPGMPPSRADLSVESMLLIKFFLTEFYTIKQIFVSPYSLKEGLIAEEIFRLV